MTRMLQKYGYERRVMAFGIDLFQTIYHSLYWWSVLIRMASFFIRAIGNTIIDAERRRTRNIASY